MDPNQFGWKMAAASKRPESHYIHTQRSNPPNDERMHTQEIEQHQTSQRIKEWSQNDAEEFLSLDQMSPFFKSKRGGQRSKYGGNSPVSPERQGQEKAPVEEAAESPSS